MKKLSVLVSCATVLALAGAGCRWPAFLSIKTTVEPITTTVTETPREMPPTIPSSGFIALSGDQEGFSAQIKLMRLPWDTYGEFSFVIDGQAKLGTFSAEKNSVTSTILTAYENSENLLGKLTIFWPMTESDTAQATWIADATGKPQNLELQTITMAHRWTVEKAHVTHTDATTNNEVCFYQSAYPLLVESEPNARVINAAIERASVGYLDTTTAISSIEQRASEYVAACVGEIQALVNELGPEEIPSLAYSLDAAGWVTLDTEDIISLRFDGYEYTGGAHGNPSLAGLTIDPKTGHTLLLKDIIAPDKLQALLAKERQILLSDEEGGYLYEETNAQFREFLALPTYPADKQVELYGNDSNFYLTEKGIVIYHTAYEIAAYAAGQFETEIPYIDMKEMIRQDGPLASYTR
ncbi:MAG TPA: DUF3298 domain-containing protein [bacterium]|nr:DUF3298 domain-containing protein [bacterium]